MKFLIPVLVFVTMILAATLVRAQDQAFASGPEITFFEESYDFGDIVQGDKVEHTFEFENTGNEPLILSNVLTTCGCTATNWPRDPIAPGKQSEITVSFNSTGKMGRQNKVVTVLSNANNPQAKVRIVTNILPPEKN